MSDIYDSIQLIEDAEDEVPAVTIAPFNPTVSTSPPLESAEAVRERHWLEMASWSKDCLRVEIVDLRAVLDATQKARQRAEIQADALAAQVDADRVESEGDGRDDQREALASLSKREIVNEIIALRGKVEGLERERDRAARGLDRLISELSIIAIELGAEQSFQAVIERVRHLREREGAAERLVEQLQSLMAVEEQKL